MMLDGLELQGRTNIVALGITTEGVKIPLGLWEGSTENATVATALLSDLVERGLDPEQGILFVIDGAKALRKAIRSVFGEAPVSGACRHKECQVKKHLPPCVAGNSEGGPWCSSMLDSDWGYGSARWCAMASDGAVPRRGLDVGRRGRARTRAARLGPDVKACVEMMSGAAWVRERLEGSG